MGLFVVFLFYFLIYSANGRLARSRGRSPIVWGIVTVIAFLLAQGILGTIYVGAVYKGAMNPQSLAAFIQANPLSALMIVLLGMGGVLAVRFYLERSGPPKR